LVFFGDCFVRHVAAKQISRATKPFLAFRADIRKQRLVIKLTTRTAAAPATKPGDSQMPTVSFILAFAFVLAGPSMAGSSAGNLPGVGTFAYSGSPIATATPQAIVVATR
jgi:hypothetical protein